MTNISAALCTILWNKFKRYYLKNGSLFLDFLLHYWNVHEIQNIWEKKDECPSLNIPEIVIS